ncbi:hypothetical protein [Glaciimonas sp. PCH181]|nr:hypothetical protein [Glaciimonas sp. PCH181]
MAKQMQLAQTGGDHNMDKKIAPSMDPKMHGKMGHMPSTSSFSDLYHGH